LPAIWRYDSSIFIGVKKGGTVSGAIAYKLTDITTPVKLTDSDVKKLLKGEQVLYKLKSNKTGKDYDGLVSITGVNGKDEQYAGSPKFNLAFPSKK